jgi:tRNA G10  N-methylase Trm11
LAAATLAKTGLYCEVNPALALVIEAKARALSFDERTRHRVASRLFRLADGLSTMLDLSPRDTGLSDAAKSVFGNRPFFDPGVFGQILQLRNLVDHEASQDRNVGLFLTIAAIRSLVPVSRLVRRGDLRFKSNIELSNHHAPSLPQAVTDSLHLIASDILDLAPAVGEVIRVGGDARALEIPNEKVDAIITSPPYLNGTNYFRNTKIELWFLRHLAARADIRALRDQAITAGINDVTVEKASVHFPGGAPKLLLDTIEALRGDAYDQRIPLMVSTYFAEMAGVASKLRRVAHGQTRVAIDLGDSCYGEVWVPTDRILAEIMVASGFEKTDEVVLRERQSRDGRKLRQTLQVFRPASMARPAKGREQAGASVEARWATFRKTLPHQTGEMAQRNWGHPWHSLCSYQGKLKPAIAHAVVGALMPDAGGRILDPFAGVGTIPFEGRLQGHTAFAFDISRAAAPVARAKLEAIEEQDALRALASLESWLALRLKTAVRHAALQGISFNGPLANYFHPRTLEEILAAREYFEEHPADRGPDALVFSSILHILHGNRPYALSRRSHPITPFAPSGPFEYRGLIERLTKVVKRRLATLVSGPPGRSYYQDATAPWPDEVNELDAIITSPPFFDSTRFYLANWMRLWFAGWNAADFVSQPARFVDERQKREFSVYDAVFAQARERLKSGGYLAFHLGKSRKCDMGEALARVGEKHLGLVDLFAESVEHCESHGIRDKGTVTHHQYLLFRKS